MDRGAWQVTAHEAAKSQTRLRTHMKVGRVCVCVAGVTGTRRQVGDAGGPQLRKMGGATPRRALIAWVGAENPSDVQTRERSYQ